MGANLAIPPGAEIIDLSNSTLLPGLIDCHVHITADPSKNYTEDLFRKTDIDEAVRAVLQDAEDGISGCPKHGFQNSHPFSHRV